MTALNVSLGAAEIGCGVGRRGHKGETGGRQGASRASGSTKKPKGEREINADPLNTCGLKSS